MSLIGAWAGGLRGWTLLLLVCLLPACPAAEPGVAAEKRPNVLFIAVDDLRNDLGALGSAQALTPQLDAFARTARVFSHHYVQVPTCGASRCALMRGCYPTSNAQVGNDAIKRTHPQWSSNSLPALFHEQGYRTLALGKITHYPGGLTGKDWAEGPQELPGVWDRAWIPQSPWKTAQAMMHGYANGVPRRPGKSPAWEAYDGPDDAYPDAWVAEEAVKTIGQLAADEQPWFFGVGFFKPHLPFAAPKKWHDLHAAVVRDLEKTVAAKPEWPSGWHASGEFRGNYGHQPGQDPNVDMEYARLLRRAYAGGISYVDAQIGRLLDALHQSGLEQDTIVVIWGDHGFLLGEHAIWGKHCLYEQAVRSPLMIRCPGLVQPGQTTSALVESVDVLPTLVDLCELPSTPVTDGRSLRAQLEDPARPSSKLAHSFWSNGQRTVRSDRWRLIVQSDDQGTPHRIELFDYSTDPNETRNHADTHPEVVQDMLAKLDLIPDFRPAARPAAKPNGRSETEKGQ